jgi:hypothetical protein
MLLTFEAIHCNAAPENGAAITSVQLKDYYIRRYRRNLN